MLVGRSRWMTTGLLLPARTGRSVAVMMPTAKTTKRIGWLDERAEGHCPAALRVAHRAHPIRCQQWRRRTRPGQNETATKDVAHVAEREPIGRQHRNQKGDDQVAAEGDDRSSEEDPARLLGDDRLLAKELREVVVGLKDSRTARL